MEAADLALGLKHTMEADGEGDGDGETGMGRGTQNQDIVFFPHFKLHKLNDEHFGLKQVLLMVVLHRDKDSASRHYSAPLKESIVENTQSYYFPNNGNEDGLHRSFQTVINRGKCCQLHTIPHLSVLFITPTDV